MNIEQLLLDALRGSNPSQKKQETLPEGVWDRDGKFFAKCRSCENTYEVCWDVDEEGFDQDMSYCGGSPSCCP